MLLRRLTHMACKLVLGGGHSFHHAVLSAGGSSVLKHGSWLATGKWLERQNKVETANVFCDLALNVTRHHFWDLCSGVQRATPFSVGGVYTKMWPCGVGDHWDCLQGTSLAHVWGVFTLRLWLQSHGGCACVYSLGVEFLERRL